MFSLQEEKMWNLGSKPGSIIDADTMMSSGEGERQVEQRHQIIREYIKNNDQEKIFEFITDNIQDIHEFENDFFKPPPHGFNFDYDAFANYLTTHLNNTSENGQLLHCVDLLEFIFKAAECGNLISWPTGAQLQKMEENTFLIEEFDSLKVPNELRFLYFVLGNRGWNWKQEWAIHNYDLEDNILEEKELSLKQIAVQKLGGTSIFAYYLNDFASQIKKSASGGNYYLHKRLDIISNRPTDRIFDHHGMDEWLYDRYETTLDNEGEEVLVGPLAPGILGILKNEELIGWVLEERMPLSFRNEKEKREYAQGFHRMYMENNSAPSLYGYPSLEKGHLKILDLSKVRELSELNLRFTETSDYSKKQELHEFLKMNSVEVRRRVEKDLNFDLSKVDLRAQISFLKYIYSASEEEVLEKGKMAKRFGLEYFISFLALESCGFGMGKIIDDLCQERKSWIAMGVLEYFRQIIERADQAEGFLQEQFGTQDPSTLEDVRQGMLNKATQLLQSSVKSDKDALRNLNELEELNSDTLLFIHAFKQATTNGASLEQCRYLSVDKYEGSVKSRDDYDQMLLLCEQGWHQLRTIMPEMYGQIMHDVLIQLNGRDPHSQEDLATTWHILKRQNKVLGFFRLDDQGNDTVYFGSLNTPVPMHGFKLGDVILREMLTKETEGKLVVAHASPKMAICRSYINRYGFLGTGLRPYYNTGEQLLEINKDRRPGKEMNYQLQGKSFAELEAVKGSNGIEVLEYSFPEDFSGKAYEQFLQDCQQRFADGLVLSAYVSDTTQYLTDPVTNKKVIRYLAGFESNKKSDSLS